MNGKERFILFSILLLAMLLLPLTVKAASEDEVVAKFFANHEYKRPNILIAPFFSVSYGKVDPSGYHYFVRSVNGSVQRNSPQTPVPLSSIYRVTSFEGGFGVGVNRGMLSFGFNYWLTAGSANSGDYQVVIDLATGLSEDLNDFTFRSEIKTWGVFLDYQYFIANPPKAFLKPTGISLRMGGGLGYYTGYWYLWDGFGGIRTDTGEFYELKDHLKGSGLGLHLSAGAEYPFWNGFLFAFDAKYMWLKFDRMRKRVSSSYELYLVDIATGDPIEVDFTGPRANFTIKRYFTL
jgi:hypothetical protein